jgi:hypothetical protein
MHLWRSKWPKIHRWHTSFDLFKNTSEFVHKDNSSIHFVTFVNYGYISMYVYVINLSIMIPFKCLLLKKLSMWSIRRKFKKAGWKKLEPKPLIPSSRLRGPVYFLAHSQQYKSQSNGSPFWMLIRHPALEVDIYISICIYFFHFFTTASQFWCHAQLFRYFSPKLMTFYICAQSFFVNKYVWKTTANDN